MQIKDLEAECRFTTHDIDEQHGQLIDAVTALEYMLETETDVDLDTAVAEFLEFLTSYFLFHSFTEEKLMYETGYPAEAYFEHIKQHKQIVLDLVAVQNMERTTLLDVSGGNPRERARQLVKSFREWIRNHVENTDRQLIEYLEAHGY